MNVFDALQVSSSGLSAQRLRLNLIAENIANVNTTSTYQGGPYVRQEPVFAAMQQPRSFQDLLDLQFRPQDAEVSVIDVIEDPRPPVIKYMPGHPDADKDGLVRLPNINIFEEMVNMISAQRSYEANVTTVNAAKSMAMKALEIGK
jgi:flagellar basal-body rod protein FlgC